jgi:hypothetical protein
MATQNSTVDTGRNPVTPVPQNPAGAVPASQPVASSGPLPGPRTEVRDMGRQNVATVDVGRRDVAPATAEKLPNPAGSEGNLGTQTPLPNLTPSTPAHEERHQGTHFDPAGGGPDLGGPGRG